MSFFHLRSLPGTIWPPVPAAEVSQLWATYLELDRSQWLSPQELEDRQLRQLRTLLAHCYEQVPYYRRLMHEAGLGSGPINSLADFRRLPVLTRALYQTHFADIQARSLPAGMTVAGSSHTSGTNGVPIKVLMTNRVGFLWRAFFLRDIEWSGIDPRGKIAAIRLVAMTPEELPQAMEGTSYPFWNKLCRTLFENGTSHKMDVRQDPRRQIQWLQRIRPDFLLSMPSNLEFLASLLQESGQRLPELRVIQAVGESLTPDVRQRIETGFGVPVKNLYSTTEVGYMASPCPSGHGLHVHSENFLAEVLDADNNPCLPGQTGRLVLTTLHNFLAPFVRYEILDDVTLAPGPCPCGRGLPLWTQVAGRRHPLLHLPNGRRKSSIGITLGIRQVGACHQFQIIQRAADHVVVRVVPDKTWQTDHAERMRQAVRSEFESEIRVDVEERSFLERPAGGKLKIVVIEMECLMADDLRKTWNDVASHWDDWGSPLRPCAEDLHLMRGALQRWLAKNPVERLQVFLCGVTPEIVTMSWPCPIELTGMDQAQRMIDVVWPGDIPGVRRAVAGNWLNSGLPAGSQDVVFNDGGFGFFDYPNGLRGLFSAIRKLLRPGGLFIGRDFAELSTRESLSQVIDAARDGHIGNFHVFKWRLAMSLQVGRNEGIRHDDIWRAWKDSGIEPTRLSQPGWSERAVGTIEFYRDSQAHLYFPTLDDFRTLLAEEFENIEVTYPGYELGDRCPVVTAQPKKSDTVSD